MDRGERRVGLLRGVNVGGHHKMLMADLRSMMNDLGFVNVETYIQSGNVVFDKGPHDSGDAEKLIATGIEDAFGFEVPVAVRSNSELSHARLMSCRFFVLVDDDEAQHNKKVHVVFLSSPPDHCISSRLDADRFPNDEFVLDGRELYVRYGDGAGQSKLTLNVIEKALGANATARNLATVNKLIEMSGR